MSDFFTF